MKSTIRHTLSVLIALAWGGASSLPIMAQIPQTMSYQGTVTSSGAAMNGQHLFAIALYDTISGGIPLYQESQEIGVTNGVFNIIIGSVVPIPKTLAFDHAYYLGVSIDGSTELPRTALSSAPYALNAHQADLAKGLVPGASGVVTSINELSGALHIVGDSTMTITTNGNVLTLHSNAISGSGIQSLDSPDKTIAIANATGPKVSVDVADSAITTRKLANGAVTPAKLAQAGATQGQIFKWEGSGWAIVNDSVDLASASGILPVTHGGTGTNSFGFGQVLLGNGQNPVSTSALVAGNGIAITPSPGAITISNTAGITGWALTGNANTIPPTNFLGTTDNQPFEIHIFNSDAPTNGSKRVMRYEPNGVSANLIGGFQGNSVSSGVVGATIAGGGLNGFNNTVTDDFSFVGGGSLNVAGNSNGSTIDANHATVVGGGGNTASATYASVLGGAGNIASGVGASIGGGSTNTASGDYSAIAGGVGDSTAGMGSSVAGGGGNVVGASANFSAIGGGLHNRTTGSFSTIPGGDSLTLGAMSFGVNVPGNAIQSSVLDLSSSNRLAYFGNMDLWLGNTDNTARALRFYAPSTSLNYSTRTFSSFFAGFQSSTINYTLPTAQPSANQVLTATGISGAGPYAVTMGWTNGNAFAWGLTGNSGTTAGTNFLGTTDNSALQIKTNSVEHLRILAGGTGGVLLPSAGSTAEQLQFQNPAASNLSSVSAGTQTVDINYTLPSSQPAVNQFLSATAVSGGGPYNVTLGWTSGGGVSAWSLTGNSSTAPGTNYLGTQDNQPFEIHVFDNDAASKGSKRVMRFEPNVTSANIISGYQGNFVGGGFVGATVSGGGNASGANGVGGNYGTVAGGLYDIADDYSSVGGGRNNYALSSNEAIPGGSNLTLTGVGSFGFNGENGIGQNPISASANKIALFGNVDVWLANTNNAASQLRFYMAQTGGPAFPSNSTHYSSFQANSQSADIQYTLPTSQPAANQVLTASSITGSGPYNVATAWTNGTAFAWGLTGNSGTTDGTNFLGTTDNTAFTIRVNNAQALRIQPATGTAPASAVGGGSDNTIASGDTASFIGFGQHNRIAASNSTILGGALDTITSTGSFSGIIASFNSKVSNQVSVIAGGEQNLIAGDNSFIGGGYTDTVTSGSYGGIAAGGAHNVVRGDDGAVIGGVNNSAYLNSFVGGGIAGLAGGTLHTGAAVIGGWDDTSYADNSVILGGQYGYIDVNSANAAIITGTNNYISAQNSTIAGGGYLRLTGSRSFGFHAGSSATDSAFVSSSNTAFFGNVHLWLGNTNNTASQLRLYASQNGGVSFPAASTHYTSFAAGSQSSDINYSLPTAAPATTGNLMLATNASPSAMAWSTNLVWDNSNLRLGINTNSPAHPLHSINSGTTDEIAAVYGIATGSTSNQAIGLWGRASNNSSANTGTIGVLATGNGNAIAGNTNVALQLNDGELAIGRTTESPSVGTDVEAATGGTAYTQQGPSGIVEFTLGASGNLPTAAPTANVVQDLGSVTINNRYCQVGSIVLVSVVAMIDDGIAPNPQDAGFIVNADNVASGSFKIRIKMLPTVTNASNYSTNDKLRVGYMIVNKSR